MNQTRVTEFILMGFPNIYNYNYVLGFLFLFIYILAVIMNVLIILLVANVPCLKSPMYFFLGHLSLSDILLTTNISPNMIHVIIHRGSRISFAGCITQLFLHGALTASDCLLLTIMSYDRYLAICKPLHYSSIMTGRLCLLSVLCSWSVSCLVTKPIVLLVCILPYCGPNVIDHYFCDIAPILDLSCSNHAIVDRVYFLIALNFTIVPLSFILFTYFSIFLTISGISSTNGKKKTFSTCSSHLIVVCMYYVAIFTVYVIPPNRQSFNFNKMISPLLYTLGIPLFNPIVYSLRNREIHAALLRYIGH